MIVVELTVTTPVVRASTAVISVAEIVASVMVTASLARPVIEAAP